MKMVEDAEDLLEYATDEEDLEGEDEEGLSSDEEGEFDEEEEAEELLPASIPHTAPQLQQMDAELPIRPPSDAERALDTDKDPYLPRSREEDLQRLLRVSSEFFDPSDPAYELKARGLYVWERVPSPEGPHVPSEVQKDLFLERLFHIRTFLSMKKRQLARQQDLAYRDLKAAVPPITPEEIRQADKLAEERLKKKEAERAAEAKKRGVKYLPPAPTPPVPPAEQRAEWMNAILDDHRRELERLRSHGWTWGKKERYLQVLRGLLLNKFRAFGDPRLPPEAVAAMLPPKEPEHSLGDILRTRRRLDKAPLYAQLEINCKTAVANPAAAAKTAA